MSGSADLPVAPATGRVLTRDDAERLGSIATAIETYNSDRDDVGRDVRFLRDLSAEALDQLVETELVHLPELFGEVFGVSSSEARRLIGQGGVRIAGERLDPSCFDVPAETIDGQQVLLGRSRSAVIRLGSEVAEGSSA